MRKTFLISIFLSFLFCIPASSQTMGSGGRRKSVALKYGADHIGRRTDEHMNRWRNHAVGQFIHWGVYSIPGGEWNGKTYRAGEWIRQYIDKAERPKYDQLYKEFNPTNFDAKKWAKISKELGAKYVIFTTKHHDGFCMWPSKYTDYTIANSPYKKDIVKQIVDAYTAEGIDVHLYFSIIDWNHKGYRSAVPVTSEEKASYKEFLEFTRNQVLELMENYPQLKGLWFDGSWDKAWIESALWVGELNKEIRSKRPDLIIGSRFRSDEYGNRGYDTNGDLIGDYDQSWERDVPESYEYLRGVDWDCIMTIPENGWGYFNDWTKIGYIKSSYNFIELLSQCASMEGNFVLNFGPDRYGNIRTEEQQLAKDIGSWVKTNGEALYGTTHIDLKKQGWGYYTRKGSKVYMHVFNIPINNELFVQMPRQTIIPKKATLLKDGTVLNIKDGGRNKKNDRLFYLELPANFKTADPFIVVLDIEGNMGDKDMYHQADT